MSIAAPRVAIVSVILVLFGTGCGPRTTSIRYAPSGIGALPQLEPVAVYRLADKRDEEPKRIGGVYGGYRNLLNRIYAEEDAAVIVTRALAEGLKARGFPVTMRLDESYLPRFSRPDTRITITGELRAFWTEAFYTNKAECAVLLQVYEVATGRKLWEKLYEAEESEGLGGGVFASIDNLREMLTRQLSKVIGNVANDPELLSHAGRL